MDNTVINVLPTGFRKYLNIINTDGVEEVRLRTDKNAILYFAADKGEFVTDYIVTREDIKESLEYITTFSLYAYEEDVKEGFITVRGGHRVGLAGKVVRENGKIKTISNISSINIRVSHQIYGCSNEIVPFIVQDDSVYNTLIISPPGAGKTTLLRDMLRQLSDVYKKKVALVDERSEIASCYKGVPQNDIGLRTDVYDCCPKTEGIMLMIRAMSPQIVAVDEVGGLCDIEAVKEAGSCGCRVLATIHGENIDDIASKSYMKECIREKLFKRYILIRKGEKRQFEIYDGELCRIA